MTYNGAQGFRSEPRFGIEVLRGHRSFKIVMEPPADDDDDPSPVAKLRAIAWDYYWQPGVNQARCLGSDIARLIDPKVCAENLHPKAMYTHTDDCPRTPPCDYPNMDCACGFYAYFDHAQVWDSFSSLSIVGAIEAWGRVVVGTYGFRAQYATIVALAAELHYPPSYSGTHPDLAKLNSVRFHGDVEAEQLEARYLVDAVSRSFPGIPVYPDRFAMLANFPTLGTPYKEATE